ncbi:MAG: endonuclease/exonuclease/phosphatase family protein [Lysobacterales bacterium]
MMRRWIRMSLCLGLVLLAGAASAARPLPRATGTDLRVLVWNVSRGQFFEHQKGYVKALSAVDADVLILDEMPADRTIDDVRAVLAQIDSRRKPDWQIAYGSSGDNQRTVFAVRGQLQPLAEFAFLPYPEGFRTQMRKLYSDSPEQLGMEQKLDGGIASFGVEARIGDHSALLVGVDLTCCGDSDDAWEEQARLVEVKEIRAALDQAWSPRQVDAVIVAGDFNAVRGRRPLLPIQGDPASGAAYLRVAEAAHANGTDRWTWDGRGTPFPSRPLDFILHNEGLELLFALVFDPETMSPRERSRLGLRRESLIALSNHRPVIADFAWR